MTVPVTTNDERVRCAPHPHFNFRTFSRKHTECSVRVEDDVTNKLRDYIFPSDFMVVAVMNSCLGCH